MTTNPLLDPVWPIEVGRRVIADLYTIRDRDRVLDREQDHRRRTSRAARWVDDVESLCSVTV